MVARRADVVGTQVHFQQNVAAGQHAGGHRVHRVAERVRRRLFNSTAKGRDDIDEVVRLDANDFFHETLLEKERETLSIF